MIAMYIPKVSPKYIPEKQPGAPERTAHPLAGLGAPIYSYYNLEQVFLYERGIQGKQHHSNGVHTGTLVCECWLH